MTKEKNYVNASASVKLFNFYRLKMAIRKVRLERDFLNKGCLQNLITNIRHKDKTAPPRSGTLQEYLSFVFAFFFSHYFK